MRAYLIFCAALLMNMPNIYPQSIITLNANDKGRVFEGIGAVSAGASTRNLVDYMERNFMFKVAIEKFGHLTGRSLTTFKRDFKKAFHTKPQKWLTQKRLELAHYQLREQKRKPSDIYAEAGFENLSHFTSELKKYFGYTPAAHHAAV
jgi:AraC-like DNA-binding protein